MSGREGTGGEGGQRTVRDQRNGSRMKVESSRLQCAKSGYELGLDDLAVNLTIMLQKPDNLDPEVQT